MQDKKFIAEKLSKEVKSIQDFSGYVNENLSRLSKFIETNKDFKKLDVFEQEQLKQQMFFMSNVSFWLERYFDIVFGRLVSIEKDIEFNKE